MSTIETKILFTDLDGTLLNDDKEISSANMEAIREMLRRGHKVVFSTGRATSSAVALAEKLGLTTEGCYAITFNGACIYDLYRGEAISRRPVPLPLVRRMMDAAYAYDLYAHTYEGTKVLAERDTRELRQYLGHTNMEAVLTEDVCRMLSEDPEKVIVISYDDKEKIQNFQKEICAWTKGKLDTFFSSDYYLEVVAPGVSKGSAILILCEMLGVPIENTVSAGDAQNDISMLETTRIGAAMKNADDGVKIHANYITEHDNNHDGLAEIIHRFIL